MESFYMVLNTSTGYTQKKHLSYKSALAEAIRLTLQEKTCEFLVLKAKALVKPDVQAAVIPLQKSKEV